MTIRDATEVFSEWALRNRDEGMESGHANSVNEMLNIAISMLEEPFSAIDVGCGNGWVCRKLQSNDNCSKIVGIDGSIEMINKAKLPFLTKKSLKGFTTALRKENFWVLNALSVSRISPCR